MKPKDFINKKADVQEADKVSVYDYSNFVRPSPDARPANLFLVGLRGSGKSTLGRAAAEKAGMTFVDTDLLVEEKAGKSIAAIVSEGGWEAFRDLESQALAEVCGRTGQIVATGGGMVLRAENRQRMRECGKTLYLMADVPLLAARLANDPDLARRPALSDSPMVEELRRTLAEREPLYMDIMDGLLQARKSLDELVEDIMERLPLMA
ncbi:shikimate kinase [Desulfocurvibacter africanus PCS]|uniref:Shikimate kinase n=1 Tax=Desulfocurvibacter africanus PCS TaxID=1262666 RepID=M5PTX6_DESAF|nr:shikimate kinase AroL [Desulfocurvibacter africanus]EMG37519.1 shikimate kinase [Desulfocurvibacter africanus PCS]